MVRKGSYLCKETLQYGWAPMAIAEVTTGFWLMLFAGKTHAPRDLQSAGIGR